MRRIHGWFAASEARKTEPKKVMGESHDVRLWCHGGGDKGQCTRVTVKTISSWMAGRCAEVLGEGVTKTVASKLPFFHTHTYTQA